MTTPSSWIESALSEQHLRIHTLTANDATRYFNELRRHFCNPSVNGPLWEVFQNRTSRKRAAGWQDIEKFVGSHKCILLVEEGPNAYECINGRELTRLLEECPGFEFYVTDSQGSYALCHNHHDYLIGCGLAFDWVNSLEDDE